MKVPVRSDMKDEIKMLIRMIPWLQRGNLEEISLRPNHPAVINYIPLGEATNGRHLDIRLVKRDQRLYLVIDELEIDKEIHKFQYESYADRLMNYLLDQRHGETVSLLEITGAIPQATSLTIKDAFRKMKYWKVFELYFMPPLTKQKFVVRNRILLSIPEVKKLLKNFNIKWSESELLSQ